MTEDEISSQRSLKTETASSSRSSSGRPMVLMCWLLLAYCRGSTGCTHAWPLLYWLGYPRHLTNRKSPSIRSLLPFLALFFILPLHPFFLSFPIPKHSPFSSPVSFHPSVHHLPAHHHPCLTCFSIPHSRCCSLHLPSRSHYSLILHFFLIPLFHSSFLRFPLSTVSSNPCIPYSSSSISILQPPLLTISSLTSFTHCHPVCLRCHAFVTASA